MTIRILTGDCRELLKTLPDESVNCVVTSPPYWGLRDYGVGGAGIGLEETLAEHLAAIVEVFREVRRVLRADGTLFLNYGDAYAGSWGAQGRGDKRSEMEIGERITGSTRKSLSETQIIAHPKRKQTGSLARHGLKAKDLMGLPWRVAFALQDDGWWLRQDIIWAKPNPMPESIRDRCTKAHEYLFLLAKSERYHFDADAISEACETDDLRRPYGSPGANALDGREAPQGNGSFHREGREKGKTVELAKGFRGGSYVGGEPGPRAETGNTIAPEGFRRNKRSVWWIASAPFGEAHFATFPPALVEPCILAGVPQGGVVLDPFGGAGTVGLVADRLQRNAILIELNPEYAAMAERRIHGDAPMFAEVQR